MSIQSAIYSILTGSTSVDAYIDARCYPLCIPEEVFNTASKKPCLVYTVSEGNRDRTFCASDTLIAGTVRIDCYAKRHSDSVSLAAAVASAFMDYNGTVSGTVIQQVSLSGLTELVDMETGNYRQSLTFTVWYY